MNSRTGSPVPAAARLEWPMAAWALPLWYALLASGWWRAGVVGPGADLSSIPAWALAAAPAMTVAGRIAGALLEASFYFLLWRGRGRSLPFWRFFCVVASASMADLLARSVVSLAREAAPGSALWAPWLAGARAAGGAVAGWPAPLGVAFGSAGLLTAVRIGLTAWGQQRALGIPARSAVAWTLLVWAASRLAIGWSVDLMRGVSPLPPG